MACDINFSAFVAAEREAVIVKMQHITYKSQSFATSRQVFFRNSVNVHLGFEYLLAPRALAVMRQAAGAASVAAADATSSAAAAAASPFASPELDSAFGDDQSILNGRPATMSAGENQGRELEPGRCLSKCMK